MYSLNSIVGTVIAGVFLVTPIAAHSGPHFLYASDAMGVEIDNMIASSWGECRKFCVDNEAASCTFFTKEKSCIAFENELRGKESFPLTSNSYAKQIKYIRSYVDGSRKFDATGNINEKPVMQTQIWYDYKDLEDSQVYQQIPMKPGPADAGTHKKCQSQCMQKTNNVRAFEFYSNYLGEGRHWCACLTFGIIQPVNNLDANKNPFGFFVKDEEKTQKTVFENFNRDKHFEKDEGL